MDTAQALSAPKITLLSSTKELEEVVSNPSAKEVNRENRNTMGDQFVDDQDIYDKSIDVVPLRAQV